MSAIGFKLQVPHHERCFFSDEGGEPTDADFVIYDRHVVRGYDRTGRRHPTASCMWHVFRCNDPKCPAEAWVRWDTLAHFISEGLSS